jgi:hypothetical protein
VISDWEVVFQVIRQLWIKIFRVKKRFARYFIFVMPASTAVEMKNGSSHLTSSKVPNTIVLETAPIRPAIIDKHVAIPLQFQQK